MSMNVTRATRGGAEDEGRRGRALKWGDSESRAFFGFGFSLSLSSLDKIDNADSFRHAKMELTMRSNQAWRMERRGTSWFRSEKLKSEMGREV